MTHSRKHYGLNRYRMKRFRFRANQRAARAHKALRDAATKGETR